MVAIFRPNNPPDHRKAKRGNLREVEKRREKSKCKKKEYAEKNE